MDDRGGQQQPRDFANCLQRRVKPPPCTIPKHPRRLPRMGTNNKHTEVGKQMHRDQPPPKGRNFRNPGDPNTHPDTSISPSGRRDSGDSVKDSETCFVVVALWLAKYGGCMQAREERAGAERQGERWEGRGVSHQPPRPRCDESRQQPDRIPAPPPREQAPPPQLPSPHRQPRPRARSAPTAAPIPAGLPPARRGRPGSRGAGGAAGRRGRRGPRLPWALAGGLKVASLPPPAPFLRAASLPPSSPLPPPPHRESGGPPPPRRSE
nr:neural Wiskott-Aldrich syndrome protein-like [Vulpes vulpes]